MKHTVYIAGPYTTGDAPSNVADAMAVWNRVTDAGYVAFLPHVSMHLHMKKWRPYQFWIDWCLEWLEKCDCVLRMPGKSKGADIEVARAGELGIPVFFSVTEMEGHFERVH